MVVTETKKKKGAQLQVCEHLLNFCPYCGSQRIVETKGRRSDEHVLYCKRCYGLFTVPCED